MKEFATTDWNSEIAETADECEGKEGEVNGARSCTEKDESEKIREKVKEETNEVFDVCLIVGSAKKPHGRNHGRWGLSRLLHHHHHQYGCSDLIERRVEGSLASHGRA